MGIHLYFTTLYFNCLSISAILLCVVDRSCDNNITMFVAGAMIIVVVGFLCYARERKTRQSASSPAPSAASSRTTPPPGNSETDPLLPNSGGEKAPGPVYSGL